MIFKRPWYLVPIVLVMFVITAGAFLRAWNGIMLWETLNELSLAVSPLYLVLTGALWGILGLRTIWWLCQGRQTAPAALRIVTIAYILYFWVDRWLLMISPLRQASWPFLMVVTLLLGSLIFTGLEIPEVKNFFGGEDEQENQP
jgi:hypothetical protein